MVKVTNFKEPVYLLGKSLKIYMKDGAAFHFKVTEARGNLINGYDDEGLNLTIDIDDIDYVVGG